MPKNGFGADTLANLRHDLKRVIRRVINQIVLPGELTLDEIMVACHTGIYASLMGQTKAPNTRGATSPGPLVWVLLVLCYGQVRRRVPQAPPETDPLSLA
ncbi:hypothetical protein GOP47_0012373 [Adiantum capillus-veneris]|uniref:Uncharacterized protein n=1 Tax=Adiantum capillus-veneris TaxID=13818 RepID=A0A9D4URL8_ADICA|nr:hypothetical protein GOP47_0012373 [Adiantum capillus-veneris]